jgi:hypothetical protein
MIRGGLSNRLIHLTKGMSPEEAASIFMRILQEGRLRGRNGYIRGGYNCVCFSEAPISILSQNLAHSHTYGLKKSTAGFNDLTS